MKQINFISAFILVAIAASVMIVSCSKDQVVLDAQTARMAGLGLQVFAGLSGGGNSIPLTLSMQDGALYLGPIQIGETPPILPGKTTRHPSTHDEHSKDDQSSLSVEAPKPVELQPLTPPPTINWQQ